MSQNHVPRSNPCYQAVVSLLEERGIKHTIKYGGRHPLIMFKYAGYHLQKPIPSTTAHRNAGRITIRRFGSFWISQTPGRSWPAISLAAPRTKLPRPRSHAQNGAVRTGLC